MKKYDVFISYSDKDRQIVSAICNKLESKGIRCWIAYRDIPPGAKWSTAITDAIKNCNILLLVFSGNSNDSDEVEKEIGLGWKYCDAIIPFRIEDIPLSGSMEYHLNNVHWIDALKEPREKKIEDLSQRIINSLPEKKKELDELELRKKLEQEDVHKKAEEKKRRAEAAALKKAEEEKRQTAEAEALKKAEEALEAYLKSEEEKLRAEAEAAALKEAEEEKRRAFVAFLKKVEEEKRQTAEAAALKKAEEEKRQEEEEALKKAEERKRQAEKARIDAIVRRKFKWLRKVDYLNLLLGLLFLVLAIGSKFVDMPKLNAPSILTALFLVAISLSCLLAKRYASNEYLRTVFVGITYSLLMGMIINTIVISITKDWLWLFPYSNYVVVPIVVILVVFITLVFTDDGLFYTRFATGCIVGYWGISIYLCFQSEIIEFSYGVKELVAHYGIMFLVIGVIFVILHRIK